MLVSCYVNTKACVCTFKLFNNANSYEKYIWLTLQQKSYATKYGKSSACQPTATFRVETSAKILAFSLKSVQDLTDVWDKIRHLKIDVHLDIFIFFRLLAKIAALDTIAIANGTPIDIERRKIDFLMTRTACLFCFIRTVNDRNKKKRRLLRAALVAGT